MDRRPVAANPTYEKQPLSREGYPPIAILALSFPTVTLR